MSHDGHDDDDYDAEKDFSASIDECYRVIRERVANGGPSWEQKPPAMRYEVKAEGDAA